MTGLDNYTRSLRDETKELKERQARVKELRAKIKEERAKVAKLGTPRRRVKQVMAFIDTLRESDDEKTAEAGRILWQQLLDVLTPTFVSRLEKEHGFRFKAKERKAQAEAKEVKGKKEAAAAKK